MIHGLKVLGPVEMLGEAKSAPEFDEIVISTDKISNERAALLVRLTELTGVRTRKMRIALD
jgi:hypothetical protein